MSSIYLYAELLFNISQITVFALLPSSCNANTHARLAHDQRTLSLWHEDEEAIIKLPCSVVHNANLAIPSVPTRDLWFRLIVSDAARLPASIKRAAEDGDPWSALKLTCETQIACGFCGALLVSKVNAWRHLPSVGWADMMDFWHCHKPRAIDENVESLGSSKGYAASNILGPTKGTGLVGVSYLLVSDIDCCGIEKSNGARFLRCISCGEIIGVKDEKESYSLQLFKCSVALQRSSGLDWETCSVQEIVSAQLVALIEEQAVYKFIVYSGKVENLQSALMLWVFTPDLMYSTSAKPMQRAMKIFYSIIVDPAKFLDEQSNKVEELQLPNRALESLQADLKASTGILPPSARTHLEWTVGLLDRWNPVL